jgi:hypothetical protein
MRKLHLISIVIQPAWDESISIKIWMIWAFGRLKRGGWSGRLLWDPHLNGWASFLLVLLDSALYLCLFDWGLVEVAIIVRSLKWYLLTLSQAEAWVLTWLDLDWGPHASILVIWLLLVVAGEDILVWDGGLLKHISIATLSKINFIIDTLSFIQV